MKGRAWKFGDDINTNLIIQGRWLFTSDPEVLRHHSFETLNPEFAKQAQPGDVIIAGENFGCGSVRDQAAISIKGVGIGCIIAKSYARLFLRNSINYGLPVLECPDCYERINDGDIVEVDPNSGKIANLTTGQSFQARPIPEFMQQIIAAGGLVGFVKQKVAERSRKP